MPKLTIQATEMKSASVDRISLVTKAASRIPFKVIKEDRTMPNPLKQPMDLASVGAIFKKEKPTAKPEVVAVVTMKGDTFEAVKAHVEAAGFTVKKADEQEDGSVLLEQVEGAELKEGITVIKMGDHTALVVKGFSPYNMQMDSTDGASFVDMVKAQGFYPGMRTTIDVLGNSIYETACKSDDPAAAAEAVSKMFDEAKQYAVGLVRALPSKAFKLEAITVEEESGGEGDGKDPDLEDKKEVVKGAADEGKPRESSEVKKAEGAEGEKKEGDPTAATGDEGKPVQKSDTPDLGKMLQDGLTAVTAQLTAKVGELLTPVQKSVEGLSGAVEGLKTKVEQVEGVAKAAEKAVKGTVMGSDAGEDATTSVQKSGDSGYGRGREIDTAYTPRRRVTAR